MKFYSDNLDSSIIESLTRKNNFLEVKYLKDGKVVNYPYSEESEQDLKETMLKQAIKRDEELYKKYKNEYIISSYALFASLIGIAWTTKEDLQLLMCIFSLIVLCSSYNLVIDLKEYNELEKYHIYLELKDEFDKPENSDIVDVIEFDKYYQIPVNITTLDQYSIIDMKILKKELKKRNRG